MNTTPQQYLITVTRRRGGEVVDTAIVPADRVESMRRIWTSDMGAGSRFRVTVREVRP